LGIARAASGANDDAPSAIEGGACSSGDAALGRLSRFGKNYRRGLRLSDTLLPDRAALELIDYSDRGIAALTPVCG
jgi:hypothetical protein